MYKISAKALIIFVFGIVTLWLSVKFDMTTLVSAIAVGLAAILGKTLANRIL